MKMSRFQHRIGAWIASFAILLVSLAPPVSHAMQAFSKAATWTEICTAAGVKLVKLVDEQVSDPFATPGHDEHYEDCPFCRIDTQTFACPPGSVTTHPVAEGVRPAPLLLYEAPNLAQSDWTSPRPRAPPQA